MTTQAPDLAESQGRSAAPWEHSRGRSAWPLTALVVGYPLWWSLGLGTVGFIIAAVPMAVALLRRRPLHVPPALGWWLLFVGWVLLSTIMMGINPSGTVPGSFAGRLLPALLVRADYLAATVVLLYVGNLREHELSRRHLERLLVLMFGWVVTGGLLGLIAPEFDFTAPLEFLIPESIRAQYYVQALVHPSAAQLQEVLGYPTARPSAPWGYTNTWANNFGTLVVWFAYACWSWRRPAWRWWGGAVLMTGLVVGLLSLNRGLWVALALSAVYLLLRTARRGQMLVAVIGVSLVAAAALALSPAGDLIAERFSTGHSNSSRSFSIEQTLPLVAQSPVLGLGTTREALGSGSSIAVARSSDCPKCGNIPLGSNGQLWFVLVGQGVVGAVAFTGFFLSAAWAYRHDRSAVGITGVLAMLLPLWFMFVYNSAANPIFFQLLGYGVLWRYGTPTRPKQRLPRTTSITVEPSGVG